MAGTTSKFGSLNEHLSVIHNVEPRLNKARHSSLTPLTLWKLISRERILTRKKSVKNGRAVQTSNFGCHVTHLVILCTLSIGFLRFKNTVVKET